MVKESLEVPEIGFYNLRKRMTAEQLEYANSILKKNITFSNSGAGTGKTTVAVACMRFLYELGLINHLYYIVSPCEEKALGHRPGTQKEKEADYMYPLHDALVEIGEVPERATDEVAGWVTPKTDTFLRGTNIKGAGVIIEEAQNWTTHQLRKGLTRLHDDCTVVVIGHDGQIDLKRPQDSGFKKCIEHFEVLGDKVGVVTLTNDFRGWVSSHADKL